MDAKRLKIGIVGLGFIGRRHIEMICRIPYAQVVAVADANIEMAREVADMLGQVDVYGTVDDMLAGTELDVVHNCTPTFLHFEVNTKVIAAGKHLYCEKPLSLDVQQADGMVAQLKKTPVASAINFNYRMNAMAQEMRERIRNSCDGRVFMVTGCYVQDWMMYESDTDWRLDTEVGGKSRAIADIGSHVFDLSQYVLGKKIVAVNAHTIIVHPQRVEYEKTGGTFSQKTGEPIRRVTVQNEDAASIMVRFEDGTDGLFQVSQTSAGHKNDFRLRVDLENASYEWRQEESDKLYIGRRGAPNQVLYREDAALSENAKAYSTLPAGHPEGWGDALYNAIAAFYKSAVAENYSGEEPYATVADGAWVMKIIEACMKSSEWNCWVSVETGERL